MCFFKTLLISIFISIPSDIQSYPIYNLFSRLLALRNIYSGRLLPLNIYSGRHWVRNALGMMDCHIHYAIVTVRFCTDIFYRFFALRNTRAGHDGQYWDDSIRKCLFRRRNKRFLFLFLFYRSPWRHPTDEAGHSCPNKCGRI